MKNVILTMLFASLFSVISFSAEATLASPKSSAEMNATIQDVQQELATINLLLESDLYIKLSSTSALSDIMDELNAVKDGLEDGESINSDELINLACTEVWCR